MKIRVINSKEEIHAVNQNEEIVHLTFKPHNTDILTLIMQYPQIKALQISSAYHRTISNYVKKCLEIRGVKLLEIDM
ncbi:DUF1699 family protein [uncultured Methanomethylovorans sp.]|jgi:hypothetical protein|uniref:DUF1699 family protein n=1 Tax=uncultured Methanomethylovorans sp. TaxID=183759 RepID=UPI002AA90D41|nr:DUF1699 family protein [uncultured Methanomethylovorans sp.]